MIINYTYMELTEDGRVAKTVTVERQEVCTLEISILQEDSSLASSWGGITFGANEGEVWIKKNNVVIASVPNKPKNKPSKSLN